ncbi:MAG: GAF domain-containing sensor histidine kinase [Ardenticatenales bacterium]|nr:GAF domain-containing sensor histidine kinase [Ardenticatenales bacterium]
MRNTFKSRTAPPTYDVNLRAPFVRRLLWGAGVGATIYLLAGFFLFPTDRLYPWLGLLTWAVCLGCAWLLRRGNVEAAARWLLAGLFWPLAAASQQYGVGSPSNALFVGGIIISGLVIGGWFLRFWTAACGGWLLLATLGQGMGMWGPPASREWLAGWVLFWWVVFAGTAWLVWLYAGNLEHTARVSQGQTAALAHTLAALTHTDNLDTFLGQALQAIAAQLQADTVTLWFHDPAQDVLALRIAYIKGEITPQAQIQPQPPPPTPVAEIPLWAELQATRRPILVDDVSNDPRLKYRARIIADGIRGILIVPLLLGAEVVGHYSVNSQTTRHYSAAELDLAQALAQQITLALQLTRLAEQAEAAAVAAAVLEERNRLARDIHDTLAQGFTGIVIQLEAAEDSLTVEPAAVLAHLERARQLARDSLAEARRSVRALRPRALQEATLPQALRRMLEDLDTRQPRLRLHQQGETRQMPARAADNLLRIGQEAVTNALKHAQAEHIDLHLTFDANAVRLTVRDDGRGFDPEQMPAGYGLAGMRERMAELGGTLTVTSAPGKGTEVEAEVVIING